MAAGYEQDCLNRRQLEQAGFSPGQRVFFRLCDRQCTAGDTYLATARSNDGPAIEAGEVRPPSPAGAGPVLWRRHHGLDRSWAMRCWRRFRRGRTANNKYQSLLHISPSRLGDATVSAGAHHHTLELGLSPLLRREPNCWPRSARPKGPTRGCKSRYHFQASHRRWPKWSRRGAKALRCAQRPTYRLACPAPF